MKRHTLPVVVLLACAAIPCGCAAFKDSHGQIQPPSAEQQAAIVAAGTMIGGPVGGAIATGGCVLLGIIAGITNARARAAQAAKDAADRAWDEAAGVYSAPPVRVVKETQG